MDTNQSSVVGLSGKKTKVEAGETNKPDVTFILEDNVLENIVNGSADIRHQYQHGKLRVDGDVKLTQHIL